MTDAIRPTIEKTETMKRLIATAFAAALAAAILVPAPAGAAGLTVLVTCESTYPGNGYTTPFFCDAYVSGGNGDYSFSWSGGPNAWFTWSYGATAGGECRVQTWAQAGVSVTDSAGNSGSDVDPFRCYAEPV